MRPGVLLRWYALREILVTEVKDNSVILDVGSYDGYLSRKLFDRFPSLRITVVDTDLSGLKIARQKGLGALYASAVDLPLRDGSVDTVLCLDVIEHIEDDGGLVKEISRVLSKGGKVILTTPMQGGVTFPLMSKEKIDVINTTGWGHLRKGYSMEKIREIFNDARLTVEKTGGYFNFFTRLFYRFFLFIPVPLPGKLLLLRAVLRLEPWCKYGAQEYIVVGRRG